MSEEVTLDTATCNSCGKPFTTWIPSGPGIEMLASTRLCIPCWHEAVETFKSLQEEPFGDLEDIS